VLALNYQPSILLCDCRHGYVFWDHMSPAVNGLGSARNKELAVLALNYQPSILLCDSMHVGSHGRGGQTAIANSYWVIVLPCGWLQG
jgi:hypothetical protein